MLTKVCSISTEKECTSSQMRTTAGNNNGTDYASRNVFFSLGLSEGSQTPSISLPSIIALAMNAKLQVEQQELQEVDADRIRTEIRNSGNTSFGTGKYSLYGLRSHITGVSTAQHLATVQPCVTEAILVGALDKHEKLRIS
ncbi:hypothetical protein SARC_00521 [Sphaeroforma arctica JP610]|uniref:Uncharacterized protein n=1 Tax=Sphaeroforma arctica JP610 TaxID=667725 RepID=A0A0L0GED6_9EUKA|nr:hypothetical protein SARC_00521 [Sphaeroforma arctica JP610]KNC87380.1 hypothetical protein SARC_00521 [Sphaeroforma arctica JP610]|eukprot:XP_014161282.1 hypothetical protein SARC_00521 [Sphaeroforma arctica JP610]